MDFLKKEGEALNEKGKVTRRGEKRMLLPRIETQVMGTTNKGS